MAEMRTLRAPWLSVKRLTLLALTGLASIGPLPSASAADVLVFAAASLKDGLDAQARHFEAATGRKVAVSYGATSTLVRQIESGAPADVLVSADLDWMDYAEKKGLIVRGTRVNLVGNALVLVAPASSKSALAIGPGFGLAAALGTGKLAMANPDSVPAGRYGKSALQQLGVWTSVEKHVARAENVRAALALVARGETPFGIVYATDARAEAHVRVVGTFPAASHPPIVYPAAIVASSKSPAARALIDHLRSAPAGRLWATYGFTVAQ